MVWAEDKRLTDDMRTFPWEQRTQYIEHWVFILMKGIVKKFPDITQEQLNFCTFDNSRPLVEQVGDGDIDCLDQAALLITFVPNRAPAAARWLYENIADDEVAQWWKAHELIRSFNTITHLYHSAAVH